MSKKPGKQPQRESGLENIEEALSRTELFIEENRNVLLTAVVVIFVIIGGFLGARKFVIEPRNMEAQAEMFMAERYFEQDSFQLAIDGDGQYAGFEEIISDYGVTKSAKLARYYIGIAYLHLGDFEAAIENLKKFNSRDKLVSVVATGAIGDAYSELEEYDKAVQYYQNAASKNSNNLTSAIYLKKAGLVYEKMENYDKAVEVYKEIKSQYPNSDEARDIEKYIAGAEIKL